MDFNLPEELQILKDTVRKFVDRELIPLERECRPEGEDMPEQFIKPLQEKAKAIGLWLLDVPQEYGGAGLDLMSRCVIMEEVARTIAIPFRYAPIFGPEVRPVLFHCNDEQKKRFLERIENPDKNWKFSASDAKERKYWNEYMDAYEDMVRNTSTPDVPWYVVPADNKWFARLVISTVIIDTLDHLDLEFPKFDRRALQGMKRMRKALEGK